MDELLKILQSNALESPESIARMLGVAPADCVFVDDTLVNVDAARDLGMAAVHFTGEPGELAEVEQLLGLRPSDATGRAGGGDD